MLIYFNICTDRLEESEEKALKKNYTAIQQALAVYVNENNFTDLTLIDNCNQDHVEDWQLGFEQRIKKNKQLQIPVNFCNDLAKEFAVDFELGLIENSMREAVSYFGNQEGHGDIFRMSEYLGL